ncbi:hydroxymethylglutaryl-CoA lyase [Rhodothalassium salexigens]|uniref:hydroxymethylglutaryl-CoA lyase n=1 Tax=Rhodothalassium salexigens TaxID=1086 RepID=UPI001911B0E3|nr:hydroxymethylglutaryl-CoA lyase [Rhodothalassium salexigens]MBK5912383.1 hydroxymethylglutaryl-CoA lyase [Rhodothalassium salexigens]
MPKRRIALVEVGPRDGLQNQRRVLSTEIKLAMIGRLMDAGVKRLEVASFVHPGRVPQMADAEAVVAGLPDALGVQYIGLVLNRRGLDRALATRTGGARGVDQVGAVAIASDTFATKNQGQTADESVAVAVDIVGAARARGLSAQVTLSAVCGCPFEGPVDAARVVDMARRVAEAEPAEIALADTIGVGVPAQVADLVGRVREAVGPIPLRGHFHDTRNTGIANVWAAVEAGVDAVDAALGGLGGCPFAPRATGNVASEDVVYLLDRSGVATGVDLDALIAANAWMRDHLDAPLPSRVARAGGFPKAKNNADAA